MAGVLALLKALLPFIKEIYTGEESLKPAQRRQRMILLSIFAGIVFLFYLGNLYIDHTRLVRNSDLEILTVKLGTLDGENRRLELQLSEHRNHLTRVELALDRNMEELRRSREELNFLQYCIQELRRTLDAQGIIGHTDLLLCSPSIAKGYGP